MENLYDYGFWFNSYENVWYAIPLKEWSLFFSGTVDRNEMENVYKSLKIDTLIQVICNPELIEWEEDETTQRFEISEEEVDDTIWPGANYHDNDDLPVE